MTSLKTERHHDFEPAALFCCFMRIGRTTWWRLHVLLHRLDPLPASHWYVSSSSAFDAALRGDDRSRYRGRNGNARSAVLACSRGTTRTPKLPRCPALGWIGRCHPGPAHFVVVTGHRCLRSIDTVGGRRCCRGRNGAARRSRRLAVGSTTTSTSAALPALGADWMMYRGLATSSWSPVNSLPARSTKVGVVVVAVENGAARTPGPGGLARLGTTTSKSPGAVLRSEWIG